MRFVVHVCLALMVVAAGMCTGRAELNLPGQVFATASAVDCRQGGSAVITMSVVDQRKRGLLSAGLGSVTFRIVKPPDQGRLSPVRPGASSSTSAEASVEYQHLGGSSGDDGFQFVVVSTRDPRRVLASGAAVIRVLRPVLQIATVGQITFPNTPAGGESRRSLNLRNAGFGLAEARLKVTPPFAVLGSSVVPVPQGQEITVGLAFRPEAAGAVTGKVNVAGVGEVLLLGAALPVVEVETTLVDFGSVDVGSEVGRAVSLRNTGERSVRVTLSSRPPFSVAPPSLVIAPQGRGACRVVFHPTGAGRISGGLTVEGGGGRRELPLVGSATAPPPPPPPPPPAPEPVAPVVVAPVPALPAPVVPPTNAAVVVPAVETAATESVVVPPTPSVVAAEPVAQPPATNRAQAMAALVAGMTRPPAGKYAPSGVQVESIKPRSAVLFWRTGARGTTTNVAIYRRRMAPNAEGTGVEWVWDRRLPARLEVKGDRCEAELHGLLPRSGNALEVRGVAPDGTEDEGGIAVMVRTPPERKDAVDLQKRGIWPLLIGAAALLFAGWALWRWWTRPLV
jgi:hypothetical protein